MYTCGILQSGSVYFHNEWRGCVECSGFKSFTQSNTRLLLHAVCVAQPPSLLLLAGGETRPFFTFLRGFTGIWAWHVALCCRFPANKPHSYRERQPALCVCIYIYAMRIFLETHLRVTTAHRLNMKNKQCVTTSSFTFLNMSKTCLFVSQQVAKANI